MADVPTTLSEKERRSASPDRVAAFTDGVFAIIITILVLDLRPPDLSGGQALGRALREIWPTFISFAISFLLVGMYWSWHRSAFAQVRFVDHNALWLNLLFLLPTSMIPFAASVLGEYPVEASALHVYGAVLITATLFRLALDLYLRRHPGLLWDVPTQQVRNLSALTAAAPLLVYTVAVAVTASLPWLSVLLYLAVPALYLALIAFLRTDPRTRIAAQDVS